MSGNRSNISLVGNTTQGQNLGGGDACVFKGKAGGNNLEFRSISATGTSIQIIQTDNEILISGATGGGGDAYWSSGTTGLYPSNGENIDLNSGCIYWNNNLYMRAFGSDATGEIAMRTNDNSYEWIFSKYSFTRNVSGDFKLNVYPFQTGTCNVSYGFVDEPNSGLGRRYDGTYSDTITFLSDNGCRHLYMHNDDMYIESDDVYLKSLPAKTTETCGIYVDANGKLSAGLISGGSGGGFTVACNGLSANTTTVKLGGNLSESTTISGDSYTHSMSFHQLSDFNVDAAAGKVVLCGCDGNIISVGQGIDICGGNNSYIHMKNLPTCTTQTDVLYIDSAGKLYSGATSGGDSYWSSGATGLSPAEGEDIYLPAGDKLKWSDSTCICSSAGESIFNSTTGVRLCANTNYLLLNNTYASTGGYLTIGGLGSKGIIDTTIGGIISYAAGNCCSVALRAGLSSSSTGAGAVRICGGSNSSTGTGGDVCIQAGASTSGTAGRIMLKELPAKSSETNVVYIDATGNLSCGAAGGGYDAYAALTYGSTVTWDTSTGLNKTLSASGNFTLSLTNRVNGMSGDLRLVVTSGPITITLPTSKLNGSVTAIPTGTYHLTWIFDGTNTDFNIATYV
jgi:hypothetical protein